MILECNLTFEAAHRNSSAGATERTGRLHGHTYEVTVAVEGALDPAIGWVMDFSEVKDRASEVTNRLDHYVLNEIDGINDGTQADVTRWLTEKLRSTLPGFHECRVKILGDRRWTPKITRRGDTIERLQFGFDAAHFLPTLPDTHKCRRVHGHSFRVAVTSKNATKLVGQLLKVHQRLDHCLLNDIHGLQNPTSELLAQWLVDGLTSRKCNFEEVMVAETCTSSCRLKAS